MRTTKIPGLDLEGKPSGETPILSVQAQNREGELLHEEVSLNSVSIPPTNMSKTKILGHRQGLCPLKMQFTKTFDEI
jgi:hypothetical protein